MDLLFGKGLVLAVLLAVLITGQVAGDRRSNWLKGIQFLAVYLILGALAPQHVQDLQASPPIVVIANLRVEVLLDRHR